MKVAITIWGNRVSPVFDSANTLMIAQIEHSKIVSRIYERFNPKLTTRIASILNHFRIDALICGAITESQSEAIEQGGIKLISFVSGDFNKILVSYINKPHQISEYLMPGAVTDTT